jgi:hypothetical protein
MEKLPKNEYFNYPISRFVREDIVELLEIFFTNCKRQELAIEGYKINSIEDINELPLKEAIVFKFQGYDPYIYVESHKFQCRLYLSDVGDVIQQGMKGKIDEIFKKNRSVFSYFAWVCRNVVAMVIIGAILGQLIIYSFSIGAFLTGIMAILFITMYYISMNKYTIVYLKKSRADLNLWEKYGEYAIVTFIVTLIAGIVVYIIQKLF